MGVQAVFYLLLSHSKVQGTATLVEVQGDIRDNHDYYLKVNHVIFMLNE